MRAILRQHGWFIVLLCIISTAYFGGVSGVPFHPDETTFLFMSTDFERITKNPLELSWEPADELVPEMRYRMIDAPLTRYLIGFSRSLFSIPILEQDWNWGSTWHENLKSGAVPDHKTLLVGRFAAAVVFPLSLVLLYLIGIKINGRLLGITAVIIFSMHPLVLLHTRRAMAESVLIFAILLALFALLHADRHPFLAGLAVALAFNAKHSAGLMLPVGLLAASWISYSAINLGRRIFNNLARFAAGFMLLTLLLNPFMWKDPLAAAQKAVSLRQDLIETQLADFQRIAPAQVLDSPVRRIAVAVAQVFIAPPVFSETGNYAEFTAPSEAAYLDSFRIQFGRQPWQAGLLIGLTLLGIFAAARSILDKENSHHRDAALLLLSYLTISVGIILLVHLAWQRYYLPLLPFVSIFVGLGLIWGIKTSRSLIANGRLSARLSEILAQFSPDSRMP